MDFFLFKGYKGIGKQAMIHWAIPLPEENSILVIIRKTPSLI